MEIKAEKIVGGWKVTKDGTPCGFLNRRRCIDNGHDPKAFDALTPAAVVEAYKKFIEMECDER